MLAAPIGNRFTWKYSNWDVPSATPGTSVVPGASNAEGTWTQIASGANIANEVLEIWLGISGGNLSTAQKDHLVDIGIDPAGGTSYTAIVSNIPCGQSDAGNRNMKQFLLPIRIPAGASVAVRAQGNNATAGTIRVAATFYGKPTRPELVRAGTFAETIGTVANSAGVSFTPGNGSEGSWVSLGTTAKALWWFQLGLQISNAATTAQYTHVDLAWGDASNKHMILENVFMSESGTAEIDSQPASQHLLEGFCEVPAGATLYVRGRCSTAPASGYNALAIGIGG